jgi:hypothetical protein
MLRRQLAAQFRILHDFDLLEPRGFDLGHLGLVAEGRERVPHRVDVVAVLLYRFRMRAEIPELFLGVRLVALRHDPVRGALEEMQHAGALREFGHELDRARRDPDHADALAGEVVVPVPARGMEPRALEVFDARNLRPHEFVEHALGADDGIGFQHHSIGGGHAPQPFVVLPRGRFHRGVQADVGAQAVLVRTVIEIREDLGLAGERTRPVELRFERERVEMRLHVALGAGVCVVVPGATDAARLFQHDEIVDARFLQLDGRADCTTTGANDDDSMSLDVRVDHEKLLVQIVLSACWPHVVARA